MLVGAQRPGLSAELGCSLPPSRCLLTGLHSVLQKGRLVCSAWLRTAWPCFYRAW